MHIVILSLVIALAVCVLLLGAFALFAHHVDRLHEPGEHQDSPRLG